MTPRPFGPVCAALVAVSAVGCVPATYVQVPPLHGRVVDADGHPVATAVVSVVRQPGGTVIATLPTAADGTFHRPEQSHFTWVRIGDPILVTYSVTATNGPRRSPPAHVHDDTRRWLGDPPAADEDLGDLGLR